MTYRHIPHPICHLWLLLMAVGSFGVPAQTLHTNRPLLDSAFRLAVWTVDHNTHNGIIEAGAGYGGEWTRDAAINCLNAVSFLRPDVAQNSLWHVTEDSLRIGHQYWDKIIWTLAAWHHYRVTADEDFLRLAYPCAATTLTELLSQCYDTTLGLFMGPALFQDGIEAYPEPVFDPRKWDDSYVLHHPHSDSIRCLSTNVLYLMAYNSMEQMASHLGLEAESNLYRDAARRLSDSILSHFYHPSEQRFDYLIDHQGTHHPYQEGLGVSLALATDLLSYNERLAVLRHLHLTPFGIPSVSPSFPRNSPDRPGRHNMMIWPHVNAFYAAACAQMGARDEFYRELENIATLAIVNGQGNFYEIYTLEGEPSGGWQCGALWDKKPHQTWCATGYLRLWLDHLFGIRCDGTNNLRFQPLGMPDGSPCTLEGLRWRDTELTIIVRGRGRHLHATLDGTPLTAPIVENTGGKVTLEIQLSE